eukprot:jgi/Tetstr1/464097/TSEL_008902.t1
MKTSKKTLLIAGLVALLLAAAAAVSYVMWQCSKADASAAASAAAEPFEGEGGEGGGEIKVEYFSMTGCGHCGKFNPVWDAVSDKAPPGVSMRKWDVKNDEGHKAAKEAGVTAFPTVHKTMPDGSVEVFTGDRTEDGLMKFIQG